MCRHYGTDLLPGHELGFDDGQLLIGFFHNVPDNTLPVIWQRQAAPIPWVPAFQAVPKAVRRGRDVNIPRENPFNVTKAVDLDDKQIGDYWVDLPGSGGFKDLVKPTSPMPMIILGGKGSGKTHILRYCSYQVQRMRHKSDVGAGLQKEGYIGIYLRCGGLNASRFSGKGQSEQAWSALFQQYMDLWLAELFVTTVSDAFPAVQQSRSSVRIAEELFDVRPESVITSAESLVEGAEGFATRVGRGDQ